MFIALARAVKRKRRSSRPPCQHQVRSQGTTGVALESTDESRSEEPSSTPVTKEADPAEHGQDQFGPERCEICKKTKHDARVYRWKLIIGLLLPYLLASLDLTVVATALPFIASHFQKLDQLNWIVTSYTLTSTAFIPCFGQLADVFGRHPCLQLSMFLMLMGSTLCAAAQTWGMLLFGRAVQGISAAGIMNLIQIVLSDKVSLKENAKNNTIFSFIAGISYSIGPIIGGYLTNTNWRYCFVISIPIAALAHVFIFFFLRKELIRGTYFTEKSRRRSFLSGLATVDLGGTTIFILGVGLIILATAWGGATYAWNSAAVLVSIILGTVFFVLFFVYEYFLEPGRWISRSCPRQIAMLPFSLYERRDMFLLAVIEFATGAALYSVFYFVGIYFTLVEAYPASKAGVQLLYYIPGIGVGVYFAMFFCNVWPSQTFLPLVLGTVIETIGVALLTWAVTTRNIALVNGMMGLAGAGTGLRFMPATLATAGIWPTRIASAMSLMRFSLPFGGTLALTIMGSVFNNKMAGVYNPNSASGNQGQGLTLHSSQSLDAIKKLPPAIQESIRNTGKNAVMWAFISILPILGLSVLASLFLGNVWIKSQKGQTEVREVESSEVMYRPYLWALLKRDVDAHKEMSTPLSKNEKEQMAEAEDVKRREVKLASTAEIGHV